MQEQTFKTGNGTVTITSEAVTLRAPGGMRTDSIRRAQITSIDQLTTIPSVFGKGGAKQITIHTSDGNKMVLKVVKPKDATAIRALLGY